MSENPYKAPAHQSATKTRMSQKTMVGLTLVVSIGGIAVAQRFGNNTVLFVVSIGSALLSLSANAIWSTILADSGYVDNDEPHDKDERETEA